MGIMSRIVRLCRADMHGVMDQLEDNELLLKQYLREMESDLRQKEVRRHQLDEDEKKLRAGWERADQEITRLEDDLKLALRKEKDDIARLLIRRQHAKRKQSENLENRLKMLGEEQEKLSSLLEDQRIRYETLKARVEAICMNEKDLGSGDFEKVFTSGDGAFTIEEEEIEIELLRRKEQLQETGREES